MLPGEGLAQHKWFSLKQQLNCPSHYFLLNSQQLHPTEKNEVQNNILTQT